MASTNDGTLLERVRDLVYVLRSARGSLDGISLTVNGPQPAECNTQTAQDPDNVRDLLALALQQANILAKEVAELGNSIGWPSEKPLAKSVGSIGGAHSR
jgi:hypothetical protein